MTDLLTRVILHEATHLDPTIEAFLLSPTMRAMSEATRTAYRTDLGHLHTWLTFHNRTPEIVTTAEMGAFVAHLCQRYEPATVARRLASYRGLFRHLVSLGMRESCPLAGASVAVRRDTVIPPSEAVLTRVQSALTAQWHDDTLPAPTRAAAQRDLCILRLLGEAGLTISEVVSLDSEQLSMEGVLVFHSRRRTTEVTLSPVLQLALSDYQLWGRQLLLPAAAVVVGPAYEPALFLNHRGGPLTRQGFWLRLQTLCHSLGLETGTVTTRSLRHVFSQRLLDAGVPPLEVKDRLRIRRAARLLTAPLVALPVAPEILVPPESSIERST